MGKKPPVSLLDKTFFDNAGLTEMTFLYYYDYLREIAMTRFKWENLPETVDERYLEKILLERGRAIFFRDEVMGYLGLNVNAYGQLNQYGIPTMREAVSYAGGKINAEIMYRNVLTDKNSVIIYDNYLHNIIIEKLRMYARRLAQIDRTIDVNVNAQKTPVLIVTSENKRLSLKQVYQQYDGNEPVIYLDDGITPEDLPHVFNTQAPYISGDLIALREHILNDALGYLGVISQAGFKQERQTAQEIIQNNSNVVARRFSGLLMRQQAADEINRMFGLNVKVSYRENDIERMSDLFSQQVDETKTVIEEGEINE